MRWVAVLAFAAWYAAAASIFAEQIRVTTWNLEWFPAGSAAPTSAEQEEERVSMAAQRLRELNPDVILLQEMRDWSTCDRLAEAIKTGEYHTLVCSAFRESFGGTLGKQQVAILAKQWAQAAWSERWAHKGQVDPPRGFAFAVIKFGDTDVGFYSLHLKSNLARHDGDLEAQRNIAKRELSAGQLIEHSSAIEKTILPSVSRIVVGGDFNTNKDQPLFISERTLDTLSEAGFVNAFNGLQLANRITHPGSGRYPDATFDYLFSKNMKLTKPPLITDSRVSDHRPVTCDFEVSAAGSSTNP